MYEEYGNPIATRRQSNATSPHRIPYEYNYIIAWSKVFLYQNISRKHS